MKFAYVGYFMLLVGLFPQQEYQNIIQTTNKFLKISLCKHILCDQYTLTIAII